MSKDPDRDAGPYRVGYGRPPKQFQFKKGQSGNPRGRPLKHRKGETLAQAIDEELSMKVSASRNGKVIKITQRRYLAAKLVKAAMEGKPIAKPVVARLLRDFEPSLAPNWDEDAKAAENVRARIEEMSKRLSANAQPLKKPLP